jgi:hypothetical protein
MKKSNGKINKKYRKSSGNIELIYKNRAMRKKIFEGIMEFE